MIADLLHLFKNIESAYFFVILFCLGFAFFGKAVFKRNRAFDFLLVAGIVVVLLRALIFLSFNRLTGRYHLPEVMVLVCFAPAGAYVLAKIVQRMLAKLNMKVAFNHILAILIFIALLVSTLKSLKITPKIFLKEFASELKAFDSPDTVLIVFYGSGQRINARLSGNIKLCNIPTASRKIWESFFYVLGRFQLQYKNIFIMTRQSKKISLKDNEFEKSVRSYYMFFPFDLVKKSNYRKRYYLLYRFNYKVADGISPGPSPDDKTPLGYCLPEKFAISGKSTSSVFDILNYLPDQFKQSNLYYNMLGSGMRGKQYANYYKFTPDKEKKYSDIKLTVSVFNQLLWPLKNSNIYISYPNDSPNTLPVLTHVNKSVLLNNAEFIPFLNLPKKIYMLPEGGRVFIDGFSALPMSKFWQSSLRCSNQFSSKGYIDILQNSKGAKIELELELKYVPLNSKKMGKTIIEIPPVKKNSKYAQLNIFMLDGNHLRRKTKKMIFKKTLNKYGLDSQIVSLSDIISTKEHFGYWDAYDKINTLENAVMKESQFSKSKIDFVLINFDPYDIYRRKHWKINSEAKEMIQKLNQFVIRVQKIFPNAFIAIMIQPSPVSEPSYHWSYLWFTQKLNHYALCQNLYKQFTNRQNENIYLVPLFHNIDPSKDYLKPSATLQEKGFKYLSITGLSRSGMQKTANSKVAWILHIISLRKRKFMNYTECPVILHKK